jgi:hypothetical protein
MLNNTDVSLPLGIFELDINGRVMAYNAYGSPLRKKQKAEVIGHSFFGELLEPGCETLEDRFLHVLRQKISFSRLYFREQSSDDKSVLLMFFPDSQSVMIQIDNAKRGH